ncbi:MAG: hypothetical protein HQM09_15535, partial [Candidatus Riflebacteria bacterium]|nr:hypothetical protein [Candidatus Riflebacteria bacterium]
EMAGDKPSHAMLTGGRAKGIEPIENRLVITSNFYGLERDLILADIATDGRLLANRTCPEVRFSYLRFELFKCVKIAAFFMGLLAGMYFISGAYFGYTPKSVAALLLVLVLSYADLALEDIGDSANFGIWLALIGGVIWKIGLFFSKYSQSPSDSTPNGGSAIKPPRPSKSDTSGAVIASLIIALSLLLPVVCNAQPATATASVEREIRVMVPFADLSKVVEPNEKMVILPVEDYRYLQELGVARAPEPERAPWDYIVRSAGYHGHVEERGVRFTAEFQIDLLNDGWKKVCLLSSDAVPSKALLDNQAIALDLISYQSGSSGENASGYGLITQATGSRRLEATFFIPFQGKDLTVHRFDLPILPLCLSSLDIDVSEPDAEGWIDPGVLSVKSSGATGTAFAALLPPTSRVRFEWFRRVTRPTSESDSFPPDMIVNESIASTTASATAEKLAGKESGVASRPEVLREETRVLLRESGLLSFEEGFVRGRHRYQLEVTGGEGIASFAFMLPDGVTVLKVDGRAIEDWRVEESAATQKLRRLQIAFNSRIKGRNEMSIEFEKDVADREEVVVEAPELVPMNVDRVVGTLGIACLPVLDLAVNSPPEGYNPIDIGEFLREYAGTTPEKTPFAFKFIRHPNKLILNLTRPRDVEVQASIVDKTEAMTVLNKDGYLLTRVAYEIRNKSEQFLKLKLPVIDGKPAELWSSEAAGQPVKAGFDRQTGMYNLPIIRSPVQNGEVMSFPVEIVFAIRMSQPVQPLMPLSLSMPWVHLTQSEMSWVVYLPEGYELMRGQGNVDFNMSTAKPQQKMLDGSHVFAASGDAMADSRSQATFAASHRDEAQKAKTSSNLMTPPQATAIGNDRLFSILGLLPVKFTLPVTNYWTAFTMQQIEPKGDAPHLEGTLVTPREGVGRLLSWGMIVLGAIAGIAFLCFVTLRRPMISFLIVCISSSILAFALLMKLYQADISFKIGFLSVVILGTLNRIYQWKPTTASDALNTTQKKTTEATPVKEV